MKMIATTKLGKAQRAMHDAKAYGEANSVVFKESDVSGESAEEGKEASSADKEEKVLYIVVSSDRGLCGGIHSSVSKKARAIVQGSDVPVRPPSHLPGRRGTDGERGSRSSSAGTSPSSSSSARSPRTSS